MPPTSFTREHTSAPASDIRSRFSNPAIQIEYNFWNTYPDCHGVPMTYVRASFTRLGKLLHPNLPDGDAVLNYEVEATEVQVTKISPDYAPTHVMAVLPFDHDDETATALYPVHHVVFSAYCAYFPALPGFFPGQDKDSREITLPVYRVILDSPAAFPIMLHYFYTRDVEWLAEVFESRPLRDLKAFIRGFRNNLLRLGVVDEPLYEAMDKAWDTCLRQHQLLRRSIQELACFAQAQDRGWLQLRQGPRVLTFGSLEPPNDTNEEACNE